MKGRSFQGSSTEAKKSSSSSTLVPMDEIDRLILQAAGLSAYSSPPTAANGPSARHIKNRKSSSKAGP